MITNYKDWYKLAKANPKVSIGIAIAIITPIDTLGFLL